MNCTTCKHKRTCDSEDHRDCLWNSCHGYKSFYEPEDDTEYCSPVTCGGSGFIASGEEYSPHRTEWDRHREETFYMYC